MSRHDIDSAIWSCENAVADLHKFVAKMDDFDAARCFAAAEELRELAARAAKEAA